MKNLMAKRYAELHYNDVEVRIINLTITNCTPPHLMVYAKLVLILLKQTVDEQFESSYMTKESKTAYNVFNAKL